MLVVTMQAVGFVVHNFMRLQYTHTIFMSFFPYPALANANGDGTLLVPWPPTGRAEPPQLIYKQKKLGLAKPS